MSTRKTRAKARQALDHRLGQLRPTSQWASPRVGWIRTIRMSLGMTGEDLGRRLQMTEAGVRALESSEAAGTIKLATLNRAADAMNCDLVVVMVPRIGLGQMVQQRADEVLAKTEQRTRQTMALEDQSAEILESSRRARRDELVDSAKLWRDVRK